MPPETIAKWDQRLEAAVRAQLHKLARPIDLPAQSIIYRQGDAPNGLYMVVDGLVRLTSYTVRGSEYLQLLVKGNEWFGEVSTIDQLPRQQEAICIGDCRLWHISMADVERIGQEHPAFWRALGGLATEHQRRALAYFAALLAENSRGRVLLMLRAFRPMSSDIPLPITHEQIAASLGLSRQTISHILTGLQREGLIKLGYRSIQLLDPTDTPRP